jgi:signal transduction histidine kinase
MFSEIDNCIERSDKIINDLIEYSQVINLQPTVTDPKSLTELSLNQIGTPANIEIINLAPAKPSIVIDADRIERAFVGIIKNAFDAMPQGGQLIIKSQVTDAGVVFSFQDTGFGMSQDTLGKLWTPLFTTKAKGMGFGLAICKRIVEAHGGEITAKSTVGLGTTITVTLPRGIS